MDLQPTISLFVANLVKITSQMSDNQIDLANIIAMSRHRLFTMYKCQRQLLIFLLGISFSMFSARLSAQALGSAGLTAADLAALRGGAGSVIGGGLQLGQGVGSLLAIPLPAMSQSDEELVPQSSQPGKDQESKKRDPLPPNEFQRYVLETTGQSLPVFGADFFDNLNNSNASLSRSPVADDYVLGPGDQILVRVWGSTSFEAPLMVDRRGEVSVPKIGTVQLAGVKASQLDGVIKAFFGRYFKDIEVSVAVTRLRKITVYAVGNVRNPGSYALSSQATLTTALFASGGPSLAGSVRKVQLRRQGHTVSEFDLYAFLGRGDKSGDLKLQDGDVIFLPPAAGYVALRGKVNLQAVFEVRDAGETVGDVLALAGGLPVVADPRRATLERVNPAKDQPRSVQDIALNDAGLRVPVRNGDVIHVQPIVAELANSVTVRGAVAQPGRFAWREGMRVSNLISHRSFLITPETVRLQSEALFDANMQERTARNRARVPADLAAERVLSEAAKAQADKVNSVGPGAPAAKPEPEKTQGKYDVTLDRNTAMAQQGKPVIAEGALVDRVGRMVEEVNLDYAVVERFDREQLKVSLLPFNLGRMLTSPGGVDDPKLQPGDVITVFTAKDVRVPVARRQVFVRIEGEVNNPGVYPVSAGENLQSLITKAGGITPDAYLYATGLYREEVKRSQQQNLEKLLRKLEAESSSAVTQASQSGGASADAALMQAKVSSIQQAQRQSLERFRNLKPEGRIALALSPELTLGPENLPALRLENGDSIQIPHRPDFVYVYGAVNTEAALIYKPGQDVRDYLSAAGISVASDTNAVILVRADGSALTNTSWWGNNVLGTKVMPGDTIVMPEKFDRESAWSQVVRNAKDFTQILYQLGLGAAAIKTLRQ